MGRLENFLKLYPKTNTIRAYKNSLRVFFETIYRENQGAVEEHAEKYFEETRNYEQDIQDFQASIRDRPPKSVNLLLAAVKTFLIENDVELKAKFWKRIRRRIAGSRAVTLDKVPSTKELRQIISHMPIQGKALYLVLASSGLRIGEALQLKEDDVDLEKDPLIVYVRREYTKTGNPRRTLISSEAKEALVEWLKVKPAYLKAAVGKSHLYDKNSEDPRIFPFKDTTAYVIWRNAVNKTGNGERDKTTNRYRLHPHSLRKYFRTKLGAVISQDVVEALLGHEKGLTEVYRKYSVEDLVKFYREGESSLLVYTETAEIKKIQQKIERQSNIQQMFIDNLVSENKRLREQVEKQRERVEKQETEIGRLQDKISGIEKEFPKLYSSIKNLDQALKDLMD